MQRASAFASILISMVIVWNSEAATNTNSTANAKTPAPIKIGKLVFEGGDGSSIETAVIIKNAKNEEEGVDAESRWIKKVHPGWQKGKQALLSDDGKKYDKIEYTTRTGETKTIYFDITDFFGKF